MTDPRLYQRMPFNPKAMMYDGASNPIHGVDFQNPDTVTNLPELYCKKFRLVENYEYIRKDYVPPKGLFDENDPKTKFKRPFIDWDYILEEVKWTAIDMMEHRKSKIAINAFISKKVKKGIRQKQTHEQEIQIYHRLVSTELASMVTDAFDLIKQRQNTEQTTDIKEEEPNEEVIKVEENYGGEEKDEEILDYDKIKKEESTTDDKKPKKKTKSTGDKTDNKIADLFKAPKPKNPDSLLRKYILNFANYDAKLQSNEIITEEEGVSGQQSLKIDKQFYVKEIQKCFSKWNKNKYAPELADALNRLTREIPDSEKNLKLQRDVSAVSGLSVKDDKKRKKSYVAPSLTAQVSQTKEVKEAPLIPLIKKPFDQDQGAAGYRDPKKLKEKDNSDELLYLFYEEPLTEQEYESMFKASIEGNKYFPKSVNDLPTTGFSKIVQNKLFYEEPIFDRDADRFISESKLELEPYIVDLQKKLAKETNKQKELAIKNTLASLPLESSVKVQDMLLYLPYINEKSFFVFIDKIKFIKASDDNDFKNQLESIKWPLHVDFVFERLNSLFGNKYPIITDVLNSNILTRGSYKFIEKICEFKWLFMQANKNRKFFNCNKKRLPTYTCLARQKEEDREDSKSSFDFQPASSQNRFKLKSTNKRFADYYSQKKESYPNESVENSFGLLANIKKHLKEESSKQIYGTEVQEKRTMETPEYVTLSRMVWPEVMNKELVNKKASNIPLTGQPIKKERTPLPNLDKIINEIVAATHVQNPTQNRPPVQPMMNPTHPVPTHMNPNQPFHPGVKQFPGPTGPQHVMQPGQYMPQKPGAMIPEQMRGQPTSMHGQYPTEMFENGMPHQGTQPPQMMNMPHSNISRGIPTSMGQPYPTNPNKMMMPTQNPMDSRGMHPGMYPSMGNVPPNVNMQMQYQQHPQQQGRMPPYHLKNYNSMNMNPNMPGNVGGGMQPGNVVPNMNPNMGSTMRSMNPQQMMNPQQQQQAPEKMKKK